MRVVLAVMLLVGMAGCGRKGSPVPPGPPSQIDYPKGYPAPAT